MPDLLNPVQQPSAGGSERTRTRTGLIYFLLLIVVIYIMMGYALTRVVSNFAEQFLEEQLSHRGLKDYELETVRLPGFALLRTSYEISVILKKGTKAKSLEATIYGNCLYSACRIEFKDSDLSALE